MGDDVQIGPKAFFVEEAIDINGAERSNAAGALGDGNTSEHYIFGQLGLLLGIAAQKGLEIVKPMAGQRNKFGNEGKIARIG